MQRKTFSAVTGRPTDVLDWAPFVNITSRLDVDWQSVNVIYRNDRSWRWGAESAHAYHSRGHGGTSNLSVFPFAFTAKNKVKTAGAYALDII